MVSRISFQKSSRINFEVFNYIKEKGLRNTTQREIILDAFLLSERHITVEDLYNIVRKKNPDIGYATVHRNLKLMSECGLADEIKVGNNRTRFEQKYGHGHHDHLICTSCGKIIEFKAPKIEELQNKVAAQYRFTIHHHKHELYGLCTGCKDKVQAS